MNSILITGSSLETRLEKASQIVKKYKLDINKFSPDILIVKSEKLVGIEEIRKIKSYIFKKAFQSKIKVVILLQAETMTLQAQNSFLKTLEEPAANSLIILLSPGKDLLLETIQSRCQLINLKPKKIEPKKDNQPMGKIFKNIIKAKLGERLKLIEPHSLNREEGISFCLNMINYLRNNKNDFSNRKRLKYLKEFEKSLKFLNYNLNVKLVLDNLVISL